jgi:hypothetical protein
MVAVPLAELVSVKPVGSVPALIDHENGAIPLEAVQVSAYRIPTVDGPLAPLQFTEVIAGGGSVIVPEYDWLCVCGVALLSVTLTE